MDCRFGKSFRLKSKSDFQYLRSQAKLARSGPFLIFFKPSLTDNQNSRIGISVSKKFGKAVERNRVKRQVREWFRSSELRNMNIDLLVLFPKRRLKLSTTDIYFHLNNGLERLKTIEIG